MDFQQLVEQLTPEVVARLKTAIETGRWPDGRELSAEQRELSLQAVILYEAKHAPENERVGYIAPKDHNHCGGSGDIAEPEAQILRFPETGNNGDAQRD